MYTSCKHVTTFLEQHKYATHHNAWMDNASPQTRHMRMWHQDMHAFMLPSTVTQNCTRGQQVEMGIMQRLLQHATCITDAHATSTHSISLLHVASGKPHRSLLTFGASSIWAQSTAKAILPKQQVHILCSHQQWHGIKDHEQAGQCQWHAT